MSAVEAILQNRELCKSRVTVIFLTTEFDMLISKDSKQAFPSVRIVEHNLLQPIILY